MDEEQALQRIDEELEAVLSGFAAPAHFSLSVNSRIRPYRTTKLPEVLDVIGWVGVLAAMFVLTVYFAHPERVFSEPQTEQHQSIR